MPTYGQTLVTLAILGAPLGVPVARLILAAVDRLERRLQRTPRA